MADPPVPLIALDPDRAGKAPIISDNGPDPVSYPVTHLRELRVPADLRVVPGRASTDADETGNAFTVPGIIAKAQKVTLRR